MLVALLYMVVFLLVIMFSFGCFAPVKTLAGKVISKVTCSTCVYSGGEGNCVNSFSSSSLCFVISMISASLFPCLTVDVSPGGDNAASAREFVVKPF